MKTRTQILWALAGLWPASAALACASCGCSVNSDWGAQGVTTLSGWMLDLRYDYLNQDRLRSGSASIAPAAAAQVVNPQTNAPAEVEQYTRNRYLTATLDYNDGQAWGVSLAVPLIDRSHSTLGTGSDGATFDPANGAYTSAGRGVGDVKVVARYFGWTEAHRFGVHFGLKLPTGAYDQFASGGAPQPVDPGLQRGTGTTDAIVGVYYFDELSPDWSYFTQLGVQTALNQSTMAGGTYRPGDSLNVSLGARYLGWTAVVPTVQLNIRAAQADSGAAADTYSTGGKLAYLTLGAIAPMSEHVAPYVNVQLPVYQDVRGIQLTPKVVVSVGAKLTF